MAVEGETTIEGRGHLVLFYESERELASTAGAHLAACVASGDAVVVVATGPHLSAFEAALVNRGIDVATARADGRWITLDAAVTLDRLIVGAAVDAVAHFDEVIGDVVRQAGAGGRTVSVYGEMVALLWDAGDVAAVMDLERLWNELGERVPFMLWCGYPTASLSGDDCADAVRDICAVHSAVAGTGVLPAGVAAPSYRERRWFAASVHAPAAARTFVADVLRQWQHDHYVDDALLIVSELAANAVVHARSDLDVELFLDDSGVRISVADNEPAPPRLRRTAPLEAGGRGLVLISALASDWGSAPSGVGKVVWADLRR
jgi:anti-sigma regulatory factor (Ser/Thr protein kinase)